MISKVNDEQKAIHIILFPQIRPFMFQQSNNKLKRLEEETNT